MKQAAEKGFFVSVGMSVLANDEVQKRVAAFPMESLLFETDAPIRFNNEKAAPAGIALVAQKVAELRGISLAEAEEAQEKSFKALFGPKVKTPF
jgi:TatD DNase family protein